MEIQWVNSGMKQMVKWGSHHRIDSGMTVGIQWVYSGMKQMVRWGSHHSINSGKYSENTVGKQWDETNGKMGVSP